MNRVLIVDDKEENRYYLHALLSGAGWQVSAAGQGEEALALARTAPPDLVISDLLMPVMDGYTLLRHWKADPQLSPTPFIIYTATYTEEADERLAFDLGVDAFILKPAEPEVFLERVRAVLARARRGEPPAQPQVRVEDGTLIRINNEKLIRKLEEKTAQLEAMNRALQADIAERKLAEAKLREQATLLDQSQDAIIVRDLEHRVLYWSQGATRIYGWTAAETEGRSVRDFLFPDHGQLAVAMERLLAQGDWSGELRQATKQGPIVIVEGRWTLLRDEQGRPKSVLAVNTDVTQRKQIEAQFLRAQRLESIGTLAGGIAHDLNNLLTPIVMGIELLRDAPGGQRAERVIETIERSALRGTELVKQVLSFARGVEGARVAVHLGHSIREIATIVQTTFPKNIVLTTECPDAIRLVAGDPTQLSQVLLNLCLNARDAMPDGGRLALRVSDADIDTQYAAMHPGLAAGRYVRLEVADTGLGMPPEVIDRIFEPFFTTKEVGKGTGLGLSTVLGIVRSHGGLVTVESGLGKGTTFRILLPAQAEGAAEPAAAPAALPRGRGELILVVDDETPILQVTRDTLEAHGYTVLTASDGAEAMGLFAPRQEEVALVLTDLMMPIMDGVTFIAALRRIRAGVRIIATSGVHVAKAETQAQSAGVAHFLTKPCTARDLLTAVARVIAD